MTPHTHTKPTLSPIPFIKNFWRSRNLFLKRFLAAGGTVFLFLFFVLLVGCKVEDFDLRIKRVPLDSGWMFRQKDTGPWLPAQVPGCVHSDLLANKKIADPFYRDNESTLQWIEEREWTYEKTFTPTREFMEKPFIQLIFYGIDTYAKVFFNDTLVLSTDNMFRRWEVDVKALLKEGENRIHVHFLVPGVETFYVWQGLGYELPGGAKVLVRKAGYHYGWDWGPRFVTAGLWQPVELQAWDSARLKSVQYVQEQMTRELAQFSAYYEIYSDRPQEAELIISTGAGETLKKYGHLRVMLIKGLNKVVIPFEIDAPRFWWCNGLGEPYLYSFTNTLKVGRALLDEVVQRVGVRTVEVVVQQDRVPNGSYGETFYFKLNGVPVFMKGSNYVPQDSFLPRVTSEQYRVLIQSCKAANMNMLRVWGGGVYESDLFYDLCDEAGILVWQDFMFACAMYPGSDAFVQSVRQEAIDNVKRLRHHPCIALWCGNNEIAEAWAMWDWQSKLTEDQRQRIAEDYLKLFHGVLPAVVAQYDAGRYYWPSSPKFGRAFYRSVYEGDSHYWGVWHDALPFSKYKEIIGRFMSEYGFQSLPAMDTINRFTLPADRQFDSKVMNAHQKHPRGNELIQTYMKREFPKPRDLRQLIYFSQLLQAEGMRTAIEAHRRAKPYCMGSLYWQLNDCWPVVSWSGLDYYGNWKALHYFVKRAFEPLLLSPVEEAGKLKVYFVSDRLEPITGNLCLSLLDMTGKILWQRDIPLTIAANSSKSVFEIEKKSLCSGLDKSKLVLHAEFKKEHAMLATALYYFVPPKDLTLSEPTIHREVKCLEFLGVKMLGLTLLSDRLVKSVYLTVEGESGSFSDNFFDLLPGRSVTVLFNGSCIEETFNKKLQLATLNQKK